MADNEIRGLQELSRLEDEEKELFSFDLPSKTMAKELQDAESPWISPKSLLSLVSMYLNERLGVGNYIRGDSEVKTLQLSVSARNMLRDDLKKLTSAQNVARKKWEMYLKGTVRAFPITFNQESAVKDKRASFITPTHPLVKQAAKYFAVSAPTYVSISYSSDSIPKGEYAFSIYVWNYVGVRSRFRLVAVSESDVIVDEIIEILTGGITGLPAKNDFTERWNALEARHISMWRNELKKFKEDTTLSASYMLGSLEYSLKHKRHVIEQQIREAYDDKLLRMKQSELENIIEKYEAKATSIKRQIAQTDIHTTLIANGVISIV